MINTFVTKQSLTQSLLTSLFLSFQPYLMVWWRLYPKLNGTHSVHVFCSFTVSLHTFLLSVLSDITPLSLSADITLQWLIQHSRTKRSSWKQSQPPQNRPSPATPSLFDQPPQRKPKLPTITSFHLTPYTLIPPDPQLPSASTSGCTDTAEYFILLQYLWRSVKLWEVEGTCLKPKQTSSSFACFLVQTNSAFISLFHHAKSCQQILFNF